MASYHLKLEEPLGVGIRRVVGTETAAAIAELDDNPDPHEAVHEARKHCKKVRAALRLVRGALSGQYTQENRCFRDAAREISDVRDAQAMLETLDDLAGEDLPLDAERLSGLRRQFEHRRDQLLASLRARGVFAELSATLREAKRRTHDWSLSAPDFDAAAGDLARVYRRGRKGLRRARRSGRTEDLHEWRKRTKYLRYQLMLLKKTCPDMVNAHVDLLHAVTDYQGFDHDLAVLNATLLDPQLVPPASPEGRRLQAYFDERRERTRQGLWPLGEQAFAESAGAFVERLRRYWKSAAAAGTGYGG